MKQLDLLYSNKSKKTQEEVGRGAYLSELNLLLIMNTGLI